MTRQPPRHPPKDASYEVGYCKPPKGTRFKPGQSGNPKGRPRGARNFRTVVRSTLAEKVTLRDGERTRKVSVMEAIVRKCANGALKGDPKAFSNLLQLIRPTGLMDEEPDSAANDSLSTQDQEIIAGFLERHGIELPDPDAEPEGEEPGGQA